MSLQTEYKLQWPEYRIEFHPGPHIPKTATLPELWPSLRAFFSGNQSRFANYLYYLSTDFSGGFSLCSILGENETANRFRDPQLVTPSAFPKESLSQIWEICQNRDFEEMERADWELIGFGFLYSGDIREFRNWVMKTKEFFGQTEDNRRFLFLLGWENSELPYENSILHMLVEYVKGNGEVLDFKTLTDAVTLDSHWQISGVLFHAIEIGWFTGEEIFRFWKFIIGFYSEWDNWEKARFRSVSLGKIPAFSALRYAKRYFTDTDFVLYKEELETSLRGDWTYGNGFGYELTHQMDPFVETVVRFRNEGEGFEDELKKELTLKPYSYFINLQLAFIYFVKKDNDKFLHFYKKAGRLKYLPLALNLYWRVLKQNGDEILGSSIERSLVASGESIHIPEGWV
ncbi:hypothetical protein ND861_15065 [Leptospira sp. 2 VSF19]|uniref:DUF1266 domain-containing protein n=1 Tax=Leptospira soteropolitanensis TaxID=2950025 RepID=A0AAW5VSB1_9LEPT|nr:hypothetical protein [Leptospira soteropolitanensis]MCW7493831.1 hypothetical protein [Leptospira soteropolitanensis]MCW7501426.1 hypothetical protein [Leptospira soteropolitanensis]MCW7523811.1 hypothetical protein [Leptospira soteropolitanensis]MCW7527676.1 hypothetical protein [Leptospira soteropolitanensis]MCW7531529.1 hypothetical protein [Leptospira soteropolitanensis]